MKLIQFSKMIKLHYFTFIIIVLMCQCYQISMTPTPQQNSNFNNNAQRPVFNSYNYNNQQQQQQRKYSNNNNQRSLQQQQQCIDNICEYDENYPSERIAQSKDILTKFSLFFDDDAMVEEAMVGPRVSDDSSEQGLCDSSKRTIYPQSMVNRNGMRQIIVNNDQFKQGISVENCRNNGEQCQYHKLFPTGTISTCKQHYTTRSLIIYNKDGTFSKDHFPIPSCCKCVIIDGGGRYNSVSSRIADHHRGSNQEQTESMFTFSP